MKKLIKALKVSVLFVAKSKIAQGCLIICILLIPVATIVTKKFINSRNVLQEEIIVSSNDGTLIEDTTLTQGKINTDVQKADDENISRYTLEDGFDEVESSEVSSSTSQSTTVPIDYSSLNGESITILEGDSFNPIIDLNLSATDKDGSDISNKIIITENNVNMEKPGYYSVTANVKLNNGSTLQRVFSVHVKETELQVSVSSFKSTQDKLKKGETIIFNLDIKSSKEYVKASYVNINGKEYPVYKGDANLFSLLSNTQKYNVKVDSEDLIGNQDYKLSYIKMSDNTLVNVNNVSTVEILKDEAKVKDFKYESEAISKKISIDFKLDDIDNSASNLKLEVYKDGEVILSRSLDKKELYEEDIDTETNGIYTIKVLADINIYSFSNEKNIVLNKEIFSQDINITNIDETDILGNDIEIVEGEDFDINSLNIKAIDVNGEDITDKLVINLDSVNTNLAGEYKVYVYVINKNNEKIEREFNVKVTKPNTNEEDIDNTINKEVDNNVIDGDVSNDYGVAMTSDFDSSSYTNKSRSTTISSSEVILGNDTETLSANVKVTGNVTKADGTMPNGKIYVEVPTKLSFSVDQAGNFSSGVFTIKNQGSTDISISVGQFKESKINSGINIRPLTEVLDGKDRSNIHLYLQGDTLIDLGESIVSDKELISIPSSDSKIVQLLGDAGKEDNTEVDTNGISEEFQLILKIKKKS